MFMGWVFQRVISLFSNLILGSSERKDATMSFGLLSGLSKASLQELVNSLPDEGTYDGFIGREVRNCCYGENRWQFPATLVSVPGGDSLAVERCEVVLGSDPSFINYRDIDRLLQTTTHIAAVFDRNGKKVPLIAVGCKHGNPCGAAVGSDPADVMERMVMGDSLALFGGLVMTNFPITETLAQILLTAGDIEGKRILDGVVAPSFAGDAVQVLQRKNNRCRLYQNPALTQLSVSSLNRDPLLIPVRGGFLRQPNYTFVLNLADSHLEKSTRLNGLGEADLMLAWAVGSTSNSNTVTLTRSGMLIGNGVGQQDRVGACELAVRRAQRAGHDPKGAVAYSDSFFPFTDGPKVLLKAGVKTILTTGGSIKDQEVRDFCAANGIGLWMIPDEVGRGFFGH